MKLVLASHGAFASGLLSSYRMIAGQNDQIVACELTEEGVGDFRTRLTELLDDALADGEKVIVYTDIKGGTPYNEAFAYSLEHPGKVQVVSGMNLPMVIEIGLQLSSDADLDSIAQEAVNIGLASIESLSNDDSDSDDLF